jgi:hypothetical protein
MGHADGVVRERVLVQQFAKPVPVERMVHNERQARAHVRLVAVSDGLNQKLPQWAVIEGQFAENVKNLASERLTLLFELLQKQIIDGALAGFAGNNVPTMAYLRLPNAVYRRSRRCCLEVSLAPGIPA